jgi:hypothetical protein
MPHQQLNQQPAHAEKTARLLEVALQSLPGVHEDRSGISVPGARALVLNDTLATGPEDAFLVAREFAHAHANGDHSLHMTLPPDLPLAAQRAGWVEPHVLAATGAVPATVVMAYAPRDELESSVVLALLRASYEYATSPPGKQAVTQPIHFTAGDDSVPRHRTPSPTAS